MFIDSLPKKIKLNKMSGHSNQVNKSYGAIIVGGNTIKGGNTTTVHVASTPAPTAVSGSTATLTGAQLLTGIITNAADTITVTLPTAALLIAAMTKPAIGDTFNVTFIKTGSNDMTLVMGDHGTLVGASAALTVSTATSATFKIRITGITTAAYSAYRIN